MIEDKIIIQTSSENFMKSAHDCVVSPHIEDMITPFLEEDIRLRSTEDVHTSKELLNIHQHFMREVEQGVMPQIVKFFQSQQLLRYGLEVFYPVYDKNTRRIYLGLNRAKHMPVDDFMI